MKLITNKLSKMESLQQGRSKHQRNVTNNDVDTVNLLRKNWRLKQALVNSVRRWNAHQSVHQVNPVGNHTNDNSYPMNLPREPIVCFGCGREGHMIRDCRSPRKGTNFEPRPNPGKFNRNQWLSSSIPNLTNFCVLPDLRSQLSVINVIKTILRNLNYANMEFKIFSALLETS